MFVYLEGLLNATGYSLLRNRRVSGWANTILERCLPSRPVRTCKNGRIHHWVISVVCDVYDHKHWLIYLTSLFILLLLTKSVDYNDRYMTLVWNCACVRTCALWIILLFENNLSRRFDDYSFFIISKQASEIEKREWFSVSEWVRELMAVGRWIRVGELMAVGRWIRVGELMAVGRWIIAGISVTK